MGSGGRRHAGKCAATNVHIVRADSPLFLRLGNRGRVLPEMSKPPPGILRRVMFGNITGEDNGLRGSIFSGIPLAQIEDVVVRNLRISMAGGGAEISAGTAIPEKDSAYPEAAMFGPQAPACGFWVRHARGVRFVDVSVTPKNPDARPCFSSGGDTPNLTINGKPL